LRDSKIVKKQARSQTKLLYKRFYLQIMDFCEDFIASVYLYALVMNHHN
jgi:hypothetical protein